MKHDFRTTFALIALFLTAQVVGLFIVERYIDYQKTSVTGEIFFEGLPFDIERPEVDESTSFIYIMSAILIGTLLLLFLVRFRKVRLWKLWFFISVAFCLTIAIGAFIPETWALIIAISLAISKVYKPNIYLHNLTEVLIYGGLAAVFAPMINIFSAFMLLLSISLYDMYAVWKSKHMIKIAKFQTKSQLFAGVLIPKKGKVVRSAKSASKNRTSQTVKTAILGGGDIGFPLIFTGVVMKTLIIGSVAQPFAFLQSLIVIFFTGTALTWLLIRSEKDKFYPAMPFLSIGCLAGYLVILLI